MALGRRMGTAELTELQPCCTGILWLERRFDVQNDLGSKDQEETGL